MKKLLLPLLILLAFSAGAQIPGATKINSRYEWLAGRFLQLKLPIYADTSQYPLWIPRLAGDVMLDTAGTDAGTVYVRYGQPPYWQAIKGDGSGGGGTDSLYTTLIGALGVEFLSSITGDSVSVYVTPYRNVDSLRKVSGAAAGQGASTLGYASPGDGGGASYWWDASSIATDDGGSIIDPIASGSGRWRLVINNGFLNPRQFGAKSGDGLDDYAAFQAANAFADSPNLTIEVPEGQFNLSTTLQLRDGVSLVGTSWVGSYINSLTSDTLIRMGSTCIVRNLYLRGADIGTVGLVMNDGSSMLVENVRFERFVLDGLLALVTNNSKVTNIKTQYNGRAQLRAVGTLNTDFTNIQANTDDAFNGVASTRGVYFEDTRNCHLHGGIIERGPGDAQGEFVNNDHLRISEIEFNNGKVGILVSGGTVTLDHVQFSNPIDFAAWAKNGGTINIINNGSPMVSGANGRPLPYLFRGNILYNGSGMFPIFSSNLRGSVSGSTIGSGTTLAFDSARANVVVSTTLAAAGISIGLGSSVYNTSPGQGFQYRVFIKNIAATNKRLALYVGLVGGSRRFISYLKPGYNVKNYIARGDETYRFNILSPQSGTNSWYMSLSELWLTSSDSLALTDSIPNTDGVMEFAMDTASRDDAQVLSAKQTHQLIDAVSVGGAGATAATATEINTGTDNAKMATPLGLAGSNYTTTSNSKLFATTTGSTTAYIAAFTPAITAYTTGMVIYLKMHATNTGNATINVNGLGVKTIYKENVTPVVAGDLVNSRFVSLIYNGSNFQLLSDGVPPTATSSVTGLLSSTDWTTFNGKLSSVDTTNITSFHTKVKSLFSATSPLAYSSVTGSLTMPIAASSTADQLWVTTAANASYGAKGIRINDTYNGGSVVLQTLAGANKLYVTTTAAAPAYVSAAGFDNPNDGTQFQFNSGQWRLTGNLGTTGNIRVGSGAATEALDVTGNAKISGNVTAANLSSGTYTPTTTGVTNVTSVSGVTGHYLRVGNEVTVSFTATITATTAGITTQFYVTIPVASNFTATTDAAGTGGESFGSVATTTADATTDSILIQYVTTSTLSRSFGGTITYTVK